MIVLRTLINAAMLVAIFVKIMEHVKIQFIPLNLMNLQNGIRI